jgi:hypothetical protein
LGKNGYVYRDSPAGTKGKGTKKGDCSTPQSPWEIQRKKLIQNRKGQEDPKTTIRWEGG